MELVCFAFFILGKGKYPRYLVSQNCKKHRSLRIVAKN
jgi:hypothetical protein